MMHTNPSFHRYVEAAAFVAVWMICGWLFRLPVNVYLLLGVPLLLLFQLLVRRRPLQELWVRDREQPLRFDGWAGVISLLLMALPAYQLFTLALPQRLWVSAAWSLCALVGGLVAGAVLRSQRGDALRRGLPSFAAAVLIGWALFAVAAVLGGHSPMVALARVPAMLNDIVLYFAVTFILEEVAFRGGLDAHVYPPGEDSSVAGAWGSAIFVSALWGLWHLPTDSLDSGQTFAQLVVIELVAQTLIGVPLSFSWRQGGTLVLPALAHALIDAYRNAVQF